MARGKKITEGERKRVIYDKSRAMPVWGKAVDCETAVELTLRLHELFYGPEAELLCEDSRSLNRVILELCDIVAERNWMNDENYWDYADFLLEIDAVTSTFIRILKEFEPDWINNEYHCMYGSDFVIALFRKYQHIAELELAGARAVFRHDSTGQEVKQTQPTSAEVLASPFNPIVPRSKHEQKQPIKVNREKPGKEPGDHEEGQKGLGSIDCVDPKHEQASE